jgi:hypothetical protein
MNISIKLRNSISRGLIVMLSIFFITDAGHSAKKKKKKDEFVMTEAELQSRVMGFSDRFAAIISQALEDYDEQRPHPDRRRIVVGDTAYAMTAAFTIAAEADPDAALLDMTVMVTLGRLVYEEHWQKKWGSEIHPIFLGYRTAEEDIWEIASLILKPDQQQELRSLIVEWRATHPDLTTFFQIRFSDFAADRRKSKLTRAKKGGGLFKSVEVATQQVEEMRLLAERGMFLGTRLPLLTGILADTWLSQLMINPGVKDMLSDMRQFSEVSGRFADVAESIPENISVERQKAIRQVMREVDTLSQKTLDRVMAKVEIERQAAIKQLVGEIGKERKQAIDDFIAEEQRVRGVLSDLEQTLSSGNELLKTTNTLLEKFDVGTPSDEPSKPFDINDYRETVSEVSGTARELTTLVNSTNELVTNVGLDQLLPKIVEAVDQVEDEGRLIIDHTFRQGIFLILIWMVAYTVARVVVHRVTRRRAQAAENA